MLHWVVVQGTVVHDLLSCEETHVAFPSQYMRWRNCLVFQGLEPIVREKSRRKYPAVIEGLGYGEKTAKAGATRHRTLKHTQRKD